METEHLSLEDGKGVDEIKDDTPEEDVSVEWVGEEEEEEEEKEDDSATYTTERKKTTVINRTFCVSVHVILEEELEKAEGIYKTSVICTLSSRLAWYSLPPEESELQLKLISNSMSVACSCLSVRASQEVAADTTNRKNPVVGNWPGTGTGWERAEGMVGTPATAPRRSLDMSENTHTLPSLPLLLE